jgi:hypothetical protein
MIAWLVSSAAASERRRDAGVESAPDGVHVDLVRLGGGREGDLTLDSLAQGRVALCQLQDQIFQPFPIQPGEGHFELGQLSHRLRLVGVGEQGGDDVLAKAAPLIRATACGIDDSGRIEDDPNAVGSKLAACHLSPKLLTSQDQGGYSTLPVVPLTSTK